MPKATIEPMTTEPSNAVMQTGEFIRLNLDQIELDPHADVRIGEAPKDEAERIDALAKTIMAEGQLQPVVVRRNGQPDKYLLVAGRRRFAAFHRISEMFEPRPIDAIIVDKTDDEAFAAAIHENLQRRQFSPIEFANLITTVKERLKADGKDWTAKVGSFLAVSRATVSQHAKLLTLPKSLQNKVNAGVITAAGAFELFTASEGSREAVAEKAEEIAVKEKAAETAQEDGKGGKGKKNRVAVGKTAKSGPSKPPQVQAKHVRQAAKELDADQKTKAKSKSEIVGLFVELSGPAYPEVMSKFMTAFLDKWIPGALSDKALITRWDAISAAVEAGERKPKKTAVK